jgi:hypothetical protein
MEQGNCRKLHFRYRIFGILLPFRCWTIHRLKFGDLSSESHATTYMNSLRRSNPTEADQSQESGFWWGGRCDGAEL